MAPDTNTETHGGTIWRITALAIAIALTIGPWTTDAEASAPMTADEEEAVDSARQMFEDAGFEFPDVDIRFHGDESACRGWDGFYEKVAGRRATVDVCYQRDGEEVDHIARARMLWHEVGHAYLEPRLDGATRTAFLDLLGLDTWNGGEWNERGGEYATETLIWGMKAGRYRTNTLLEDLDDETLAAGYALLTGLEAS